MQSLDEENTRTQDEIESIKKSIQTLDDDITREKGIIIDANSNEKRLKEEKTCLLYTSPSPRDRTRSRMPSSA